MVPDPVPELEPKEVPVTDPLVLKIQPPPPLLHHLLPALAAGGLGAVFVRVGAGMLVVALG